MKICVTEVIEMHAKFLMFEKCCEMNVRKVTLYKKTRETCCRIYLEFHIQVLPLQSTKTSFSLRSVFLSTN